MRLSVSILSVFAVFALLSVFTTVSVCAENDSEFVVRPNKPGESVVASDGFECRFQYEATGGTSETWQSMLQLVGGDQISCTVGRPNMASYLYFTKFSLGIFKVGSADPVKVASGAQATVLSGTGDVLSATGKFVISSSDASIASAPTYTGGEIGMIELSAKLPANKGDEL